jgi:hypothetical protein
MATVTFVLGQSGTGKSTSMRNLDPAQTLLIQALRKPLPFRAKGWSYLSKENTAGNMIVCDAAIDIISYMKRTKRKVIILDDFQYTMSNSFMRRSNERGFDKFTDIARDVWDMLMAAAALPDDVRVYVMSHTDTNDAGVTKPRTIGKLLDERICIEGMVTIVLQTVVMDRHYMFMTQNNGQTVCKSPMGMFDADEIENDLAEVDRHIVEYYAAETA